MINRILTFYSFVIQFDQEKISCQSMNMPVKNAAINLTVFD